MTKLLQSNTFTIEDTTIKGYSDPTECWNGWACPHFEIGDICRFLVLSGNKFAYDPEQDAIFITNLEWPEWEPEIYPGADYETVDGVKHLYPVGAWAWTWDVVE